MLPAAIVGSMIVLLVPLPAGLLDLLLVANISGAVLVLLTVLAVRSPQEFSTFPTILLATTLTRLVLNVASTRRILTHGGQEGLDAAGGVIRAFGEFVAGDQVIVGAVLFAILVIIQFVVITKGATRISEVAARFMLDGLPGRQMAIDADLHAGLIGQAEASARREAMYRQADFFGAMDGAGKFVRGDALAGMAITLVNIIGGLVMGVLVQGMRLDEAIAVFTKLTIGDGLVSQVPAFLTALAAGLIVTRSSAETDLGREVSHQLLGRVEVLGSAAALLALLAFTGLPMVPLLTVAGLLGAGAVVGSRRPPGSREPEPTTVEPEPLPAGRPRAEPSESTGLRERLDELLQVDPLELQVGYRLIGVVDPERGGDLLERIRQLRESLARELGLVVPQVRIRDMVDLGPYQYRVVMRGASVGQGIAYAGRLLAIPPAALLQKPDGRQGVDPVTGQPAVWIHAEGREVAELAGCRVLDAAAVIAGHFRELVLAHAEELVTHEQVRWFLDRARAVAPTVVEDVVPRLLRPGQLRRVLQLLVRERVSIRDAETILEALAECDPTTDDPLVQTSRVRRALGRQLVQPWLDSSGRLHAARLPVEVEQAEQTPAEGPEPASSAPRALVRAVAEAVSPLVAEGRPPVLVVSDQARWRIAQQARRELPQLVVLARGELPEDLEVVWEGAGRQTDPTHVEASAWIASPGVPAGVSVGAGSGGGSMAAAGFESRSERPPKPGPTRTDPPSRRTIRWPAAGSEPQR
jgi:flagellar biosynthesis protein FlhA